MIQENEDKGKLANEISKTRADIESQIKKIEERIYELETKYLDTTSSTGNILRGWEQFFTAKSKISQGSLFNPKKAKWSTNDRIFSQSSISNHCLKEDYPGIQALSLRSNILNNAMASHRISNGAHRHKKKKLSLSLKKKQLNGKQVINSRNDENVDGSY